MINEDLIPLDELKKLIKAEKYSDFQEKLFKSFLSYEELNNLKAFAEGADASSLIKVIEDKITNDIEEQVNKLSQGVGINDDFSFSSSSVSSQDSGQKRSQEKINNQIEKIKSYLSGLERKIKDDEKINLNKNSDSLIEYFEPGCFFPEAFSKICHRYRNDFKNIDFEYFIIFKCLIDFDSKYYKNNPSDPARFNYLDSFLESVKAELGNDDIENILAGVTNNINSDDF